jgi:hypothetical protein
MTYALSQVLDQNFTDARFVGSNAESLTGDYRDEATLDTVLNGANGAYYTAALLATMTTNDKIYAFRMHSDPLSFGTPGTTVLPTGTSVEPQAEYKAEVKTGSHNKK